MQSSNISPNKSKLKPPPKLSQINPKPQLNPLPKSPPKLKQMNKSVIQTPQFLNLQSPPDSPRKMAKKSKKTKIKNINDHARQTVNSITLQQKQVNNNNNEQSQLQSPVKRINHRDTMDRLTYRNKYLSITSLPQDFQFRPSKNSLKRLQYNNEYDYQQNNGIDKCLQCDYEGQMDKVYKLGWVAWSWIVFLLLSTLILFFIPLVVKNYQQQQIICPQCGSLVRKQTPTCL